MKLAGNQQVCNLMTGVSRVMVTVAVSLLISYPVKKILYVLHPHFDGA